MAALKTSQAKQIIDPPDYRAIRLAISRGKPDEARAGLEKLMSKGMPSKADVDFATDSYLQLRDYKTAYWYAEVACFQHDRNGEALLRLARLGVLTSSYNIAANWLEEYLASNPGNPVAISTLGECQIRQGDYTGALNTLRQNNWNSGGHVRWLSSVVEGGKRVRPADWYGRTMNHIPKRWNINWRNRFFRSPIEYRPRNLSEIDQWINGGRYVSDQRLFGSADYWQPPHDFEKKREGDCEDFALWVWVQLARLKYKARFVIGGLFSDEINHAWVCLYGARGPQVLECTPRGYNSSVDARHTPEYRPFYSIDKTMKWYKHFNA